MSINKRAAGNSYFDRYGASLQDISTNAFFDTPEGVLDPRGFRAHVGTSTSPTVTGTKAVTGVGFQPKVVLPFGGVNVGAAGNDALLAFGAGTSASNRSGISVSSFHNQTTSNTNRRHINNRIYSALSGLGSTFEEADLSSLDSDGFTLNYNAVAGTARILNHICLGGTDLEVSLTQHITNNTDPQILPHGLSGAPTAILFFNSVLSNTTTTDLKFRVGCWSGGNQWCAAVSSLSGQTTTRAVRVLYNDCANVLYDNGYGFYRKMTVNSVDETNVSLSYSGANITVHGTTAMLAIRGAKAQVGTFDCNGSTSPLTISCSGITPKLFLPVIMRNGVSGINTVQNFVFLTIGASDGINNVSCGITDANGVTTTNARRYQSSNSIVQYDQNGGKYFEATASFLGESVIVDPTLIVTSQWGQGGYLILGQ